MLCVFNGTDEILTGSGGSMAEEASIAVAERRRFRLWSHVLLQRHLSGYYLNGPLSILKMRQNPSARQNASSSFYPWGFATTKNP